MDIFKRFWASATSIEQEIAARLTSAAHPPAQMEMRFNGGVAPDVGRYYAAIIASAGLPEEARILDLGCGFGRIAMALTHSLGPKQRYFGLDPNAEGIDWAQRNIAPHHPNFSFDRIDIKSLPYNPEGWIEGSSFRFPFEDGSLDLVFMISVLTHVDLATVQTYAREAARVLTPQTGRFITTIFLLDDQVDRLLAAGKGHFRMSHPFGPSRVETLKNPELAIAHPRQAVVEILSAAGFAQTTVFEGSWSGRDVAVPMNFQDLVIADRCTGSVPRLPWQPLLTTGEIDPAAALICQRLAARTQGNDVALAHFITWANAVTVNAFWWQSEGLQLDCEGGTAGQGSNLMTFDTLRSLGLDAFRPGDAGQAGDFYPLDDGAMIALLIRLRRAVSRDTLFACLMEAAGNGLRLLEALEGGQKLVLKPMAGPVRPAPIPQLGG